MMMVIYEIRDVEDKCLEVASFGETYYLRKSFATMQHAIYTYAYLHIYLGTSRLLASRLCGLRSCVMVCRRS